MIRYHKALIVALLAIVVFVMGVAPNADAVFKLWMSDGTTTVVVEDQYTGPFVGPGPGPGATVSDLDPTLGVVQYNHLASGSIGVFDVLVTVGTSKPKIGPGRMDLFNLNVNSSGPGKLTIMLSDTNYYNPMPHPGLLLHGGGLTDGTVNFNSWFDDVNNLPFAMSSSGPSAGPFGGAFSFSESQADPIPVATPYSLTIEAIIDHTGPGQMTSFNAAIAPVPEPGTLLLLGSGLIGLAGYGRLRLKRKKR